MDQNSITNIKPENKREILEQLIREQASKIRTAPLSYGQKRLFFIHKLQPESTVYQIFRILRLTGDIRIDLFIKALNEIVKRHDSFRTAFREKDGEDFQIVKPFLGVHVPVHDLSDVSSEQREETALHMINAERKLQFILSEGNLFRFKLYKLSSSEYFFSICIHHIITDGWSMRIFYRELTSLYNSYINNSPASLDRLAVQYTDYAISQQKSSAFEKPKKQILYWKNKLENSPVLHQLPTDFIRPAEQTFEGEVVGIDIDSITVEGLKNICQKTMTTMNMVLLGAYSVLISRYSNFNDIVIGSPNANRNQKDIEPLIGFFVSTLPLRINIAENITFKDLLAQVKRTILEAADNQEVPFEQIVEELQPERTLNHSPIFQLLFAYHNFPGIKFDFLGMRAEFVRTKKASIEVDLEVHLNNTVDGLNGSFIYNKSLFQRKSIVRMTTHFLNILKNISRSIDQKVSEIEILSDNERKQILEEFNDTSAIFPQNKSIVDLFEAIVARQGNSPALVFEGDTISYNDLNERANHLARKILDAGVKNEDKIGIFMPRCSEMIIGILGVLKAGCAYIPIDPDYPMGRVKYIMEDSDLKLLVTVPDLQHLFDLKGTSIRCINATSKELQYNENNNVGRSIGSSSLAYLIYTSGSTGNPKGVMIEHKSVVNFIYGVTSKIEFSIDSKILCLTTISFDIFVLETILPLLKGLTIVLAGSADQKDPNALAKLIRDQHVDMLQITPSRLKLLLSNDQIEKCIKGVKTIMVGGEAFPFELFQALKSKYKGKIYNMYGPTETTVWSTIRDLTMATSIDVGTPISNTVIRILNTTNHLQPVGIVGELCIGGEGLARGYWKKEELTDEKFIKDPVDGKLSIYRTGDLARWLPDGNIELIGRLDSQVKIRGFRIELGEIESVLNENDNVKEAVVITYDKGQDDKILVAFVILSDKSKSTLKLKAFLKSKLPDYMVPSTIIIVDKMPLTPNGKIDRRALIFKISENTQESENYIEPKTDLEKKITEIWKEVLHSKNVSTNDNFFDIGGHSLLLTQVVSLLKNRAGIEIDLIDLFRYPTIREICNYLNKNTSSDELVAVNNSKIESRNNLLKIFSRDRNLKREIE
jgi:amino acid adenylation domain-containing protein